MKPKQSLTCNLNASIHIGLLQGLIEDLKRALQIHFENLPKWLSTYLTVSIFASLSFLPFTVYCQQSLKGDTNRHRIVLPDTSEEGLVDQIENKLKTSKLVMDAEVVSSKSKWGKFHYEMNPNGIKGIYTEVTFRIIHLIKGSVRGDDITFYQRGGKIGDTTEWVSSAPEFSVGDRGIMFFRNIQPNSYIIPNGGITIFGAVHGRHGDVFVGTESVDSEDYINILRKAVNDTTAYRKYIRKLKMAEKRERDHKNGLFNADSIHRAIRKTGATYGDSLKGGVK